MYVYLSSDLGFYKIDLEFILQPMAVPLCHLDFKWLTSPDLYSHAYGGDLCATFALIQITEQENRVVY